MDWACSSIIACSTHLDSAPLHLGRVVASYGLRADLSHAPRFRFASSRSWAARLYSFSDAARNVNIPGGIWERVHAILACTQKIPWSLKETREDDLSRVTTSNSSGPHSLEPHRVLICTLRYKGRALCKLTVLVFLCSPATLRSHLPSASIHPSQHRRQTDMGLLCKIFTNVLSPSSRIHI